MGKCGGRELNYISDVDVIFVGEPLGEGEDPTSALRTATALATGVMSICQDFTTEGAIWQVDAALRPEGKDGALVRTLASHVGYYERWAPDSQPLISRGLIGEMFRDIEEAARLAKDRPDVLARLDQLQHYLRYTHLRWLFDHEKEKSRQKELAEIGRAHV